MRSGFFARVIYGKITNPALETIPDLDKREMALLVPLVALVIYYGVQPNPIHSTSQASVQMVVKQVEARIAAGASEKTAEAVPPHPNRIDGEGT